MLFTERVVKQKAALCIAEAEETAEVVEVVGDFDGACVVEREAVEEPMYSSDLQQRLSVTLTYSRRGLLYQ